MAIYFIYVYLMNIYMTFVKVIRPYRQILLQQTCIIRLHKSRMKKFHVYDLKII